MNVHKKRRRAHEKLTVWRLGRFMRLRADYMTETYPGTTWAPAVQRLSRGWVGYVRQLSGPPVRRTLDWAPKISLGGTKTKGESE